MKFPFTHCEKLPPTQAISPAWHGVLVVNVANFAFSFCASSPFCRVKAALLFGSVST